MSEDLDSLTKKLEEMRNTKVITLFFSTTSINDDVVAETYENLENIFSSGPVENLDIILHSYGGDIDAAYQLTLLLRKYVKGKLTFIVPRFAKSAATLMVCGGDAVVMGDLSELGPLDPQISVGDRMGLQIERFSPLSIPFIFNYMDKLIKEDKPLVAQLLMERMGALSIGEHIRSLEVGKNYLQKLLGRMFKDQVDKEVIKVIARKLVEDYPHHGYCINADEAENIGLKIERPSYDEWKTIWAIYKLLDAESKKITQDIEVPENVKKILGLKNVA